MTDNFEYTVNGKTMTLPLLRGPHMTMGTVRKTVGLPIVPAIMVTLGDFYDAGLIDDESMAAFDAMPQSEFGAFIKAWNEASGVTLGESAAS